MTTIPLYGDGDLADQQTPVRADDRDIGLDTGGLHPLTERIRAAFDTADISDRIDQAWITPTADDDYDCLAY
ncbi:hypothetical protein [Nocardia sp. NPDC059691]|uniref:hypothetical protein n=1 Tax=unclassified Nocardia TaxID=2637762 RepID=UPI0036799438